MMPLPPKQVERRSGRVDEALANNERLSKMLRAVGLLLAVYVAVAVTVASVIGVTNSLSARDNAEQGAEYALDALNQARKNGEIAENVEHLVAQQAPCEQGDPPESPACVRQARSNAVVAAAIESFKKAVAESLEVHDLNTDAAHDRILLRAGRTTSPRTSLTTLAPSTTRATTTTRAATVTSPTTLVRPPSPLATCDRNGRSNQCKK